MTTVMDLPSAASLPFSLFPDEQELFQARAGSSGKYVDEKELQLSRPVPEPKPSAAENITGQSRALQEVLRQVSIIAPMAGNDQAQRQSLLKLFHELANCLPAPPELEALRIWFHSSKEHPVRWHR